MTQEFHITNEEAIRATLAALQQAGCESMITGSLASNFYGLPRSTKDADLVIDPASFEISAIVKSLPVGLKLDPQLSFETVTTTTRHQILIQNGDPFLIELFFLSDDEHDRLRFQRKRVVEFLGIKADIATAEDVVITKLRWSQAGNRRKDIEDVRNVMAVQGSALDWEYIESWCEQHGTSALLQGIRSEFSD